MTSQAIRDPLGDHLITPQNAAFVLIDYQPEQLAAVTSMDHELLVKNAVSTVRTGKIFGVPELQRDWARVETVPAIVEIVLTDRLLHA
jgi:hypothetical protein